MTKLLSASEHFLHLMKIIFNTYILCQVPTTPFSYDLYYRKLAFYIIKLMLDKNLTSVFYLLVCYL